MRTWHVLLGCLLLAGAPMVPEAVAQTGPDFPTIVTADTVRSNSWLVEALMADIVRQTLEDLPPPPLAIELHPLALEEPEELFGTVATRILGEAGYDLFLYRPRPPAQRSGQGQGQGTGQPAGGQGQDDDAGDPDGTESAASAVVPVGDGGGEHGPTDLAYRFRIAEVTLDYPEMQRRFGIWRQWVDRTLRVTAQVTVLEQGSGRILVNDRVSRSFRDRMVSDDFDRVHSEVFGLAQASPRESGWRRRLEEMVVLGTLAGLVAVYFANTGN